MKAKVTIRRGLAIGLLVALRTIRSPLRLLPILALRLAGSGTMLHPGPTAQAASPAAFTTTNIAGTSGGGNVP
jgi:hypothetical protein